MINRHVTRTPHMDNLEFTKTLVKLPHDARRWLEAKSSYNQTPMTAEILRALRERMEREAA